MLNLPIFSRHSQPIAILALLVLLALAGACSSTVNNGNGTAGPSDTVNGGDLATGDNGAGNDTVGGGDVNSGDSAGTDKDAEVADTKDTDTAGTDVDGPDDFGLDVLEPKDGISGDAIGTDTISDSSSDDAIGDTTIIISDIKPGDGVIGPDGEIVADGGCVIKPNDAGSSSDLGAADAGSPFTCKTDADCLGVSFPPCSPASCDTSSGKCQIVKAKDGTTCAVSGACGGPGVCASGACNAPSTCKPSACAPVPLACGAKVTIELATLNPSSLFGYGNCSSSKWGGPEAVVVLPSDITAIATLSTDASGVTVDYELFDIALTKAGLCDTLACDAHDYGSFSNLTLGLHPGNPRVVVLDTSATDTGVITLSLDCSAATLCGDSNCDAGETCGNCKKDCGECTGGSACGDKTCGVGEDCANCPGDCGTCDPGCTASATGDPGCSGCTCEACVCANDDYCCTNSWDSSCASECAGCGAKCPSVSKCGDDNCDFNTEDEFSCPNDCYYASCGDGICDVSGGETCTSCAQDCGMCSVGTGSVGGCGNGVCDSSENCLTCAADCGACGDYTCACKVDSACCTKNFGYTCQDECTTCTKANGGGSCPLYECGDGVCAGETCSSCSADCGKCPPSCGDGTCDSGETATTCPKDCAVGCAGKCGTSSKTAAGKFCYCDTFCFTNGDCCDDVKQFCCQ